MILNFTLKKSQTQFRRMLVASGAPVFQNASLNIQNLNMDSEPLSSLFGLKPCKKLIANSAVLVIIPPGRAGAGEGRGGMWCEAATSKASILKRSFGNPRTERIGGVDSLQESLHSHPLTLH